MLVSPFSMFKMQSATVETRTDNLLQGSVFLELKLPVLVGQSKVREQGSYAT